MILSSAVFGAGLLTSSGCAVATAGVKKGDERSVSRSLNDVSAHRAIRARMRRAAGFSLTGVDIDVAEGIVLLSGNVPRTEDRIEAERIAWSADRVLQVGNEIFIKEGQGQIRNIKDGYLNQSIRARLVATKEVKARNFGIEVQNGIVYIMGIARTPEELALAAHIASTTRGTKEVISYARVFGDSSAHTATGPGYNGQPSESASNRGAVNLPPIGNYTPQTTILDSDAIESGEPYYLDPQTGKRVEIPEGAVPIPYNPDAFPSDQFLGTNRVGTPGEAVSVIESAPYMLDPTTGEMVPVKFDGAKWVPILIK